MAETLQDKFGPKVLKAMMLVIKDEINNLRSNASLAERTDQQIMDALTAKFEAL